MSDRTYTAKLKDRDIKITSRDLAVFREMHVGKSDLANRMSELLWFDIYVLDAAFGASTHDILRAIHEVEQEESSTGVKPATQYHKLPLKGLWHKHYFSGHFIVQNMISGLGKKGLERLVDEVLAPEKPVITQEMINELAHRVVHDPLEARDASKRLTGEWIVYLKHEGRNYFLCCNTHGAGDQFIYDRIMQHCVRDFPDLPAWVEAQQS